MSKKSESRHIIALAVAVAFFMNVTAQSRFTLSDLQRLSLPINEQRLSDFTANPAAMFYRDSISVSSLSLTANWSDEEKPVIEQLGDGLSTIALSAESYSRRGADAVVWGAASFRTGTYRNIRWTDCIDYLRIAPYVLGDEVGGDLSTRQYNFSGGYVSRISNWTVGTHVAYRAEIAFRNRDPRVKTIVSDLDFSIGATRRITDGNILGLDVALNVYNQNCDLDFYNPINDINTYTLTGLGTYYRRFMGNSNKNSGYNSFGYTIGSQWQPTDGNGLSAFATYNHYRMEQQLRNFNNLTLGFAENDLLNCLLSYSLPISTAITFRPEIEGEIRQRKGTENLFGTSSGASYDKIGSRMPYKATDSYASLTLPLQIAHGKSSFVTIQPSVAYQNQEESYNEPLRKIKVSNITPEMTIDLSSISSGNYLWNIAFGGGYTRNISAESTFSDIDTSSAIDQCVLSNYSMQCADRLKLNASASISRPVDKVILTLKIGYSMTDYKNEGKCQAACLTLAAKF